MKPVVYYVPSPLDSVVEGYSAVISNVINHPATDRVRNTPGRIVRTSRVINKLIRGFNTLNTRYRVVSAKTARKRFNYET